MSSDNDSPQNLPLLQETPLTFNNSPMPGQDTSAGSSDIGHQNNKICRVCGDKALGYNFNVVTCESCKAFFRRNALRAESKAFRCAFNDNCVINVVSRRFCQKCRLRKCFEVKVGMKKDWIMSEDARLQKRMRIQENRRKKLELDATSLDGQNFQPPAKRPPPSLAAPVSPHSSASGIGTPIQLNNNNEDNQSQFLSLTTRSNEDWNSITIPKQVLVKLLTQQTDTRSNSALSRDQNKRTTCSCTCTCGALPTNTPLQQQKSPQVTVETQTDSVWTNDLWAGDFTNLCSPDFPLNLATDDLVSNMLNAAISSEFTADCAIPSSGTPVPSSPLTPGSFRDSNATLSPGAQKKLNELISANEVMKEPLERFIDEKRKEKPSLTDVINMTDIAIRRIIKMSKRIAGFKHLCQEDQIALLKGGCTELMILRGVMTYSPEKDSWQCSPDSQDIKCEVLKGVKGGNVYEEHKRYLSSFQSSWRTSEPIMLILGAITLFNPTRNHVQHREIIKTEQDIYYCLLKRYLESTHSICEAQGIYEQLVQKIDDLHILNDNIVRIFLDVNPQDVEPLLIEIFDLK